MSRIMLHGVLDCPIEPGDDMGVNQLVERAKEASELIYQLDEQIKKMKCCKNCKHYNVFSIYQDNCEAPEYCIRDNHGEASGAIKDLWELKE